ncbi:ester cyclase [Larkinella soli]|uniref:ester cyclase n=1 Tax=Larkinella soli TaxID=1770527 RepID=UPI0013E2F1D9|nr:ester cyclase [Larkinella soli]
MERRTDILAHNRRLIEAYFQEVWNEGRLDRLDDLLTPDYRNHSSSIPNPQPGPEGLKPIVQAIRNAFPDLNYRIEDLIVTEDRVVARVVMSGTQTGDFFGIAPTGRRIEVSQMNIEAVRDGRIAEHWRLTDEAAMLRQMGTAG